MQRLWPLIFFALGVSANPIAVYIVNEFQVAPDDSELLELRYFRSAAGDTVYSDSFPLVNTQITTPPGQSFIDTSIYLPGMGYVVIDSSMLTGPFGLPEDSGYIIVTNTPIGWGDSVAYPRLCIPTPPIHCSAAKFHFYYWDIGGYNLGYDWYIDSTPTFGSDNDDYPGCSISGNIYDHNGAPLPSARVIAIATYYDYIFDTPPYYKCCTTYSALDGSYKIDSLLPWSYWVKVWAEGYLPDSQLTDICWACPGNIDFYLQSGISEDYLQNRIEKTFFYPNPAHNNLRIVTSRPLSQFELYDVNGRSIMLIRLENPSSHIQFDCSALPKGIYFLQAGEESIKLLRF